VAAAGVTHDRTCEECGKRFTAPTTRRKFCSATCRGRSSRAGRSGKPRPHQARVVAIDGGPEVGEVAAAVRAELVAAGREGSSLGLAAVALATRIDTGSDTGASLATAVRALTETMSEALKGTAAPSALDELKARRRAKRGA